MRHAPTYETPIQILVQLASVSPISRTYIGNQGLSYSSRVCLSVLLLFASKNKSRRCGHVGNSKKFENSWKLSLKQTANTSLSFIGPNLGTYPTSNPWFSETFCCWFSWMLFLTLSWENDLISWTFFFHMAGEKTQSSINIEIFWLGVPTWWTPTKVTSYKWSYNHYNPEK